MIRPWTARLLGASSIVLAPVFLSAPDPGSARSRFEVRERFSDVSPSERAASAAREDLARAAARYGDESVPFADALDRLVGALIVGGCEEATDCLELARRSVTLHEKIGGPGDIETARALAREVTILYGRGDRETARQLFARSISIKTSVLGPDDPEVVRLVVRFPDLHEDRGLMRRALEIEERELGPSHPDVAYALTNFGWLLEQQGSFPEALELMDRAVAIVDGGSASPEPSQARTLYMRGRLLTIMGRYSVARRDLERALAIAEATLRPNHGYFGQIFDNLGALLACVGDWQGARRMYERAVELERDREPDDMALFLNRYQLGEALENLAEPEAARAAYEESLVRAVKCGGPEGPFVVFPLSRLAGLARRAEHDMSKARRLFERALAIHEKSPLPYDVDMALRVADLIRAAPDDASALRVARRAHEADVRANGPRSPFSVATLQAMGRLHGRLGEHAAARRRAAEAVRVGESVLGAEHPDVVEALLSLAAVEWSAGRPAASLAAALRAEATIRDDVRHVAESLAEREALRFEAGSRTGFDLLLTALASRPSDRRVARQAWDEIVRSRALVLDATAGRHRVALEHPSPPIAEAARGLVAARERFARSVVTDGRAPEGTMDRARLDRARDDVEAAERRLAAESAEYRERWRARSAGADEIASALPARSALLAFVRYDRLPPPGAAPFDAVASYMAFVASGGGTVRAVPLGSAADVDAAVDGWRSAISTLPSDPAAAVRYATCGARLRRAVWDPVAAHLAGAERVFVVADGRLHEVSLATLPTAPARFLVDDGPEFAYLSAERDLVEPGASDASGSGLLVVGGVDFDREPARVEPPAVQAYRGPMSSRVRFLARPFAPLPGSRDEAAIVAESWRATAADVIALTGSNAEEGAFKRLAPGRRVIHLATHAFVVDVLRTPADDGPPADEDPLLLSGLVLAGANRRASAFESDLEDGILTAEEIGSIDLRGVDWVVLSGCGTALGPVQSGEGVLGLRRAFRIAGARSLVTSLWPVLDQATGDWTRALYASRASGATASRAVRDASLAVLRQRRASGAPSHPFFWGAFIAVGSR